MLGAELAVGEVGEVASRGTVKLLAHPLKQKRLTTHPKNPNELTPPPW